jgi:hypothetical protein
MLVEAAFAAARVPGPLRAFHERVRARRGLQIAIVATARKLAVLCWHLIAKGEDYAFQRPSLTAKKLRALELRAGMPSRRGRKGAAGAAGAYSLREVRRRESAFAEQGEHAYRPARRKLAEQGAGQSGGGCRHRGAALRPSSGNPARRGFHPHAPLFGPGSPAPAAILRPEPPLAT